MKAEDKKNDVRRHQKPIEFLADKLPVAQLGVLNQIHQAHVQGDHQRELNGLDALRKEVSFLASRPGLSSSGLNRNQDFKLCLDAIDAMRGTANDHMNGVKNLPEITMASDRQAIPQPLLEHIDAIRKAALHIDPVMSREVSLYLGRVQICAQKGAFDLMAKFSKATEEKLRASYADSRQPLLGPIAARVRDIGEASQHLHARIRGNLDPVNPRSTADTEASAKAPSTSNQKIGGVPSTGMGSALERISQHDKQTPRTTSRIRPR